MSKPTSAIRADTERDLPQQNMSGVPRTVHRVMVDSGGQRTASGLFYQYLFTIETFLKLIDDGWPSATEVWIEDCGDPRVRDHDIIDFSVHHPDGTVHSVHQAKSTATPERTTLSANDALEILIRLVDSVDCSQYLLTTNARAGREIDRLNTLLSDAEAEKMSEHSLISELREIASTSDVSAAAVSSLDSARIDRLRRARVRATGEPSTRIRGRITDRIAAWRRDHQLSLGKRAALLLGNSLITNVFERAAGTRVDMSDTNRSYRAVSLADFEALLAERTFVLAEAAAIAESGSGIHRVPSGEGVERPELLEEIARRFDNVRTRDVRRCALAGMSGIGKSRLAAMYAHRERESYDRVCWIDASSDASIVASITSQARIIGVDLPDKLTPEEIAPAFRESIGTFTGRWLIVFDDARDSRALEPWTPQAGTAHVLVTSTNSVDWTAFEPVPVRTMDRQQSLQLLRSRLVDDLQTNEPGDRLLLDIALTRLADELERWPLALQIAAAHFGTTSSVVTGVDAYLSEVAEYVIDDDTLDRDGYPRTLQVAINICLDRLAASRNTERASEVGLRMLAASSVLASCAIPEMLLFTIATVPLQTLVQDAGRHLVPHTDQPLVDRAVRRIRAESLIERGDTLDDNAPRELRVHVDVNDIVQRIVRQRFELTGLLNCSAGHLSTWLEHFLVCQDFPSAIVLQPHALALLELARDVDHEDLRWCALLAGNQSVFLDLQGKSTDAKDWLLFELRLLKRFPHPPSRLIAKTAGQIAGVLLHLGTSGAEIESYIDIATSALEDATHAGDGDWDGERVRLSMLECVRALRRRAQHDGRSGHSLTRLQQRLNTLRDSFQGFGDELQHALAISIENDLDDGRDEVALAGARRLLQELAPNDHRGRLDARVREIEALAMLGDVGEVRSRLADFASDRDRHRAVIGTLASGLLDAAAAIEMRIILALTGEWECSVVAQLLRVSRVLLVSEYDRYRHALLAACEASHHDDTNGVRHLLQFAESVKPTALPETVRSDAVLEHTAEWLEYWLECAEKNSRARAVTCDAHRRRLLIRDDGTKSITLFLVVPALHDELSRATRKPGEYLGTWRRGWLGYERTLDLRRTTFRQPTACILIGHQPACDDDRVADPLDWIDNDRSVVQYEVVLKSSMTSNDDLVVAMT